MRICKKIVVTGQVQGVFFRDSTRQKATALKLFGMVRNLRDGRVEVQVAGESSAVQLLIKWLEIGPKLAKVSTIEVIDLALTTTDNQYLTEFEIWPTALSTK
jgi:acylphosphatase